jgi:hypothetical protein
MRFLEKEITNYYNINSIIYYKLSSSSSALNKFSFLRVFASIKIVLLFASFLLLLLDDDDVVGLVALLAVILKLRSLKLKVFLIDDDLLFRILCCS